MWIYAAMVLAVGLVVALPSWLRALPMGWRGLAGAVVLGLLFGVAMLPVGHYGFVRLLRHRSVSSMRLDANAMIWCGPHEALLGRIHAHSIREIVLTRDVLGSIVLVQAGAQTQALRVADHQQARWLSAVLQRWATDQGRREDEASKTAGRQLGALKGHTTQERS